MPRTGGFFLLVSLALVICAYGRPTVTVTAQDKREIESSAPSATPDRSQAPESIAELSGQIVAAPGGRPFRGVEVVLVNISSGATLRTRTDARGRYKFNGIVTGVDYVLTPWKPDYVFSPGALVVTHTEAAVDYDFTGMPELIARP